MQPLSNYLAVAKGPEGRDIGTLVYVGSGSRVPTSTFRAHVRARLVLIEGDPDAGAELLRNTGNQAWVEVHAQPIAPIAGLIKWHRYTLPALNGPIEVSALQYHYPRLRETARTELLAIRLSDVLAAIPDTPLDGGSDVLFMDVPGQESRLLASLSPELVQRFATIVIRAAGASEQVTEPHEPPLLSALREHGYKQLLLDADSEPLWPIIIMQLDRGSRVAPEPTPQHTDPADKREESRQPPEANDPKHQWPRPREASETTAAQWAAEDTQREPSEAPEAASHIDVDVQSLRDERARLVRKNVEAEGIAERLADRMAASARKIVELEEKASALNLARATAEKLASESQRKFEDALNSAKVLQQELTDVTREKLELERRVGELQESSRRTAEDHESRTTQTTRRLAELTSALETAETLASNRLRELEESQSTVDLVQEKLEASTENVRGLERRLAELETRRIELELEVASSAKQLDIRSAERDRQEEHLHALITDLSVVQLAYADAQSRQTDLERQASESSHALSVATSDLGRLRLELTEVEEDGERKAERLFELEEHLREADKERSTLVERLKLEAAERERQSASITSLDSDLRTLTANHAELQAEHAAVLKHLSEANRALQARSSECDDIGRRYSALSDDAAKLQMALVEQAQERDVLAEAIRGLEASIHEEAKTNETLKLALNAERERTSELQQELDTLNRQLHDLAQSRTEDARELASLRAAASEAQQVAAERLEQAAHSITVASERTMALEARLDETTRSLAEAVELGEELRQSLHDRDLRIERDASASKANQELIEQLHSSVEHASKHAHSLEAQIAERDAEVLALRRLREESQTAQAEHASRINYLEGELNRLHQFSSDTMHQHAELAKQLESIISAGAAETTSNVERIQALTKERDEQAHWHEENAKWARSLQSERDALREKTRELEAQVGALKSESAALQVRLGELESSQPKLLQQIEERDARQRLLDSELLKAEAQLELIKDVLLREKNF